MKPLNEKDLKIARAANAILWLWGGLIVQSNGDPWYRHDARQAYQDAVIAMMSCGLIEDYDVVKTQVKIKGVWTNARQVISLE